MVSHSKNHICLFSHFHRVHLIILQNLKFHMSCALQGCLRVITVKTTICESVLSGTVVLSLPITTKMVKEEQNPNSEVHKLIYHNVTLTLAYPTPSVISICPAIWPQFYNTTKQSPNNDGATVRWQQYGHFLLFEYSATLKIPVFLVSLQ